MATWPSLHKYGASSKTKSYEPTDTRKTLQFFSNVFSPNACEAVFFDRWPYLLITALTSIDQTNTLEDEDMEHLLSPGNITCFCSAVWYKNVANKIISFLAGR